MPLRLALGLRNSAYNELEYCDQPMSNENLIETLEATGDYRVLRRLRPRTHYNEPDGSDTKLAIFLDLETTGLNPNKNEIIEIAMVPFDFSGDGQIFDVHEAFNQFQEPKSGTIPKEITRITGITDAMVRGKNIDVGKVALFGFFRF